MTFWERLKNKIKEENTTQEWVANQIDVSYRTFRGWISRKIMPNADQAVLIAQILHTSVEYLVTGKHDDTFVPERLKDLVVIAAELPDNRIDDLLKIATAWVDESEKPNMNVG